MSLLLLKCLSDILFLIVRSLILNKWLSKLLYKLTETLKKIYKEVTPSILSGRRKEGKNEECLGCVLDNVLAVWLLTLFWVTALALSSRLWRVNGANDCSQVYVPVFWSRQHGGNRKTGEGMTLIFKAQTSSFSMASEQCLSAFSPSPLLTATNRAPGISAFGRHLFQW